MSGKSAFRLSAQSSKNRDHIMHPAFSQRSTISPEDGVFMGLDPYASIRHSPQFAWQSLTPELRSEAIRRAQLIHLLRQVNPNLQLCRKSSSGPVLANTAEKAIQVPDMRYGFVNDRRFSNRSEVKIGASFTAPGVRIQPRTRPPSQISRSAPEFNIQPPPNVPKQNTTLDVPDQRQGITPLSPRQRTLQAILETTSSAEPDTSPERKEDDAIKKNGEKVNGSKEEKDDENVLIVEDKSSQKNERQVVVKNKETSSGDEDSVVVVLNQPSSEQGLERKYGQFFCRRCLRGWSSRSVWCMRHTCKVYIKQTCNFCNKLVNPYLVCRLPPISSARKDRK